AGPFAPNCRLRSVWHVGQSHCTTSHVSCCTVPSLHFTAPAISTNRHTFSQLAPPSLDRATALKSGSQLAPQPNNTPSLRSARHASCGAPASSVNVAPPSLD